MEGGNAAGIGVPAPQHPVAKGGAGVVFSEWSFPLMLTAWYNAACRSSMASGRCKVDGGSQTVALHLTSVQH